MKSFCLFGYRFTVERFQPWDVFVRIGDYRSSDVLERSFDKSDDAAQYLVRRLRSLASYNPNRDIFGYVQHRVTGEIHASLNGFDGVQESRVVYVSGFIGKRNV